MIKPIYFILFLIFFIQIDHSIAAIAEYDAPVILARANITDGYNIPPMSFLNSTSPVINNDGDVAFKIMAVEGTNTQALWVKTAEDQNGKIVYEAPDERFITDPTINDAGKVAFNLFDEGVTDGLFIFDSITMDVDQVLSPDKFDIQYYTYPTIMGNDHIYFRGTDDNDDRSFFEFNKLDLNKKISEGLDYFGLKSSYLFRPSINQNGQIAFKARLGEKGQFDESRPDSIILMSPSLDPATQEMKLHMIASDRDNDPESKFIRFGNSVSLNENGSVAFMGTLLDNKKAIIVSKDNTLTYFATEGKNNISEIEIFAPKLNNQNLVLFRAKDNEGKRGLYLADGSSVKRIIGEGDDIETDLGAGKILSNPNYPGFGGEIGMNDQGEIVFYCLVVNSDNKELGSAVYKIKPKL